jgi:hypothetical protein
MLGGRQCCTQRGVAATDDHHISRGRKHVLSTPILATRAHYTRPARHFQTSTCRKLSARR